MNFLSFFTLQLKRTLKKKHLLVILLFFFLCMLFLSRTTAQEEDSRIPVALCVETEDPLALTLQNRLLSSDDSLFRFFTVETLDDLTRTIENGSAECGYLIRKPLQYELEKKHINNLIRIYVSENTTCKGVLNEFVYANLFEEYAEVLLKNCLFKADRLPFTKEAALRFDKPPVTDEKIDSIYRSYTEGDETFTFALYTVASDNTQTQTDPAEVSGTYAAVLPLFHGLTALFLLLGGFLALLTVVADRSHGLYDKLHGIEGLFASALTMLAVLLPFGGASLIAMTFFGAGNGFFTELLALLVYLPTLLLFYGILGQIIKHPTVLCGAFPMILLITVVFTPIITDLSSFFPWIKTIRYFLPSYYYLMFF